MVSSEWLSTGQGTRTWDLLLGEFVEVVQLTLVGCTAPMPKEEPFDIDFSFNVGLTDNGNYRGSHTIAELGCVRAHP